MGLSSTHCHGAAEMTTLIEYAMAFLIFSVSVSLLAISFGAFRDLWRKSKNT